MSSLSKVVSSLRGKLSNLAPCFDITHCPTQLILGPTNFYQELKEAISSAKNRIVLTSLYVGAQEDELKNCLEEALLKRPSLEVFMLFDELRSFRVNSKRNSMDLLRPLVEKFPKQISISLYRSPKLPSWLESFPRYRELSGVMHTKVLIFDNDLLLTGANLSKEYFTNRQDRYLWIRKAGELTDYLTEWLGILSNLSHITLPNQSLERVPNTLEFRERFSRFQEIWLSRSLDCHKEMITTITPVIQAGPIEIRQHEQSLNLITSGLKSLAGFDQIFTTAYFNPTGALIDTIFKESNSNQSSILVAAPEATTFHGSKGISRHVPGLYAERQVEFLHKVPQVSMSEYHRKNWTFHAKGFWFCHDKLPFLTTIGSSNYGKRSMEKDVEVDFIIMTLDKNIQNELKRELDNLTRYTTRVSREQLMKRVKELPYWARFVSKISKSLL